MVDDVFKTVEIVPILASNNIHKGGRKLYNRIVTFSPLILLRACME